jgi:hypothetical protein
MYRAKTLFTGYLIDQKDHHLYVGVPAKYHKDGKVTVKYKEEVRTFYPHQVVGAREFPDKFSDGTYTLNYYLWKKR